MASSARDEERGQRVEEVLEHGRLRGARLGRSRRGRTAAGRGRVVGRAGTAALELTSGKKVRKDSLKQFSPCTSKKKYKRLKPGKYRFFVAAVDAAGNADPTPAKRKFKIVKDA